MILREFERSFFLGHKLCFEVAIRPSETMKLIRFHATEDGGSRFQEN
jgi:hypothetical protein